MFVEKLTKEDLEQFMPEGHYIEELRPSDDALYILYSVDVEDLYTNHPTATITLNSLSPYDKSTILDSFYVQDFNGGNLKITNANWQSFMLDKFGKPYFQQLEKDRSAVLEVIKYYREEYPSYKKSVTGIREDLEKGIQTTLKDFLSNDQEEKNFNLS